MKLLHTADWHLGLSLNGKSMLEDQEAILADLCRVVREEQIDLLLLAGDVFDRAVAGAEAIELYDRTITTLCLDLGCQIVAIAGNHDGASRLASCSALLRQGGFHIAGKARLPLLPVEWEDVAVWPLPYFTIEDARSCFPHQTLTDYNQAMAAFLSTITPIPGKRNILVSHCFAAGAITSESDRAAVVGGSSQVAPALFEPFDYVALGHLHRMQRAGTKGMYSGTPLPYSFAEVGQVKSVLLLDTEDPEFLPRPIPLVPLRGMQQVTGRWEELLIAAQTDPHPDDYIKVEMTDAYAGLDKLERFRAIYPNLLSLVGKPLQLEGERSSLTAEQLETFTPEEILTQFCRELGDFEPDAQQLGWFTQAREKWEREEGVQ